MIVQASIAVAVSLEFAQIQANRRRRHSNQSQPFLFDFSFRWPLSSLHWLVKSTLSLCGNRTCSKLCDIEHVLNFVTFFLWAFILTMKYLGTFHMLWCLTLWQNRSIKSTIWFRLEPSALWMLMCMVYAIPIGKEVILHKTHTNIR